jgi:hypothetical protein
MTERFRFLDALTYGIRTLFWRPVRALAYIAVITALTYAYNTWMQSEAGLAFFGDYMQMTQSMAQGRFEGSVGTFAVMLAASFLFSLAMMAGGYRVYVRDEPVLRLPLQLGFDELRLLGVYILISLIGTGLMILSMIPMMILVGVAAFLAAQAGVNLSDADGGQTAVVGAAIMLFVLVPWLFFYGYVTSRLSVGLALAIRDRKFRLGGWKASKGAGLQLLFAHIVLYIVLMVAMFALSPGMLAMMTTAMTDPTAMQDPAIMTELTTHPYGNMAWLAIPLISLLTFLMFGPTAAVANWDARKRAAAEAAAAPAAEPVVAPADGNGTGEASGHPDTASS